MEVMHKDLTALKAHPSISPGIKKAIDQSSGAELHRCALQVNPFEYLKRHAITTSYISEENYNEDMIAACLKHNISVIGITDHFRVNTAERLAQCARQAGITALVGFEANSSDGVHVLCLFPEDRSLDDISLVIGACGVSNFSVQSPQAKINCEDILDLIVERGGVAIAAHVCSASGLLLALRGQARSKVWTSENLTAVCLPGRREDAPFEHRGILKNNDAAHKRERPVAIVNANDVSDPKSFENPACTTLVRMSSRSIEGLRQAFLDWESRIHLNSDEPPEDHVELIAAAWEGGLLDGQAIRFNSGLNALIGGRGAGKSTLIESLRHVFGLEPKGKEAGRSHDGLIKNVLRNGTKIQVLLYSPFPSPQRYLLERVIPNATVIRNEAGVLLPGLTPKDIVPNIECYGQHEVSELTRNPELLAHLLDRFVEKDAADISGKVELKRKLSDSQDRIKRISSSLRQAEDDVAGLPALREKLSRYEAVGLGERLNAKSLIDREKRLLTSRKEQVANFEAAINNLQIESVASETAADGEEPSPRLSLMDEADEAIATLEKSLTKAKGSLAVVAEQARLTIDDVESRWQAVVDPLNEQYQALLRDLQKEGIDGADFIATQNQIAALRQRELDVDQLGSELKNARLERTATVIEWENVKAAELRALEKAARKVGQKLENCVRVNVRRGTSLKQIEAVLKSAVVGQGTAAAVDKLKSNDALSLSDLANAVREGQQAIVARYGFTSNFSEKLASGGNDLAMQIEQCELPAEAIVELNVAEQDVAANWKKLDDLSTGQKATAVLLLLLLGSSEPLIVDQPEDDLDNRFITESVVPTMRIEKRRRQFIFSTHNANIPVLADAEQIVGLTATVQQSIERTLIRTELVGSIDAEPIKKLVGNLLEGGQKAFELRRRKYGF